ncbi:MAG: hypothetical protein RLZZ540_2474 [Bacteroidota bacterium]|jgi:hypothetical protein
MLQDKTNNPIKERPISINEIGLSFYILRCNPKVMPLYDEMLFC